MRTYPIVVLASGLVAACSSPSDVAFGGASSSTGNSCVPGQEIACTCNDGSSGSQTCDAAGDGYGPCSCAGSSSTSGAGGAGGAGGTTSAQGGSGAQGGGGIGGGLLCKGGSTAQCYDGSPGTEGIGNCVGGVKTCAPDGMSFGPCMGEVLPGIDDCATAADEDCNGSPVPCVNDMPWSERFACDNLTASALAVDASGNILLVGYFYGACDVGKGPLVSAGDSDILLAKFDKNGKALWSKRFGDASQQQGLGVGVDGSGNAVIVGSTQASSSLDFGGGVLGSNSSTGFMAKFDAAGNHVWSKPVSSAALSVAIDSSNNILVVGLFVGNADFGSGPVNAPDLAGYLVKYSANGSYVFSKVFVPTGGHGAAQNVGVDGVGNIVIAGYFAGTLDFGGGPLASNGMTEYDVFLTKLDSSGSHLWSHRYGDQWQQRPGGIAVRSSGEIALTGFVEGNINFGGSDIGTFNNSGNMFLAKFDGAGNHVFSYGWGDDQWQSGSSVAFTAGGNVLATGNFTGNADFGGGIKTGLGGQDVAIVAFDPSGNHVFSGLFGGAGNDVAGAIAADGFGKMVVAGSFPGTIDFGLGPLTSTGGVNGFLAKLGP